MASAENIENVTSWLSMLGNIKGPQQAYVQILTGEAGFAASIADLADKASKGQLNRNEVIDVLSNAISIGTGIASALGYVNPYVRMASIAIELFNYLDRNDWDLDKVGADIDDLASSLGLDTDTQYDDLYGDNYPTFKIFDTQVRENDDKAVVFVALNRSFDKEVVINLSYESDTADKSDDYNPMQYSLTIKPNETIGYIEIPIIDDNKKEYDEIFTVRATIANYQDFTEPENLELNGSHYNQTATITILDNEEILYYDIHIDNEIRGNDRNNYIHATSGNDLIYGGLGDDIMFGEAGDDIIYGDKLPYNSHFINSYGNDEIYGGDGNDILIGGCLRDILIGGSGDDILYGGYDNDTYIFNKGDGNDIIYDNGGIDKLLFSRDISKNDLIISRYDIYGIKISFKNSPNDSIIIHDAIDKNQTRYGVIEEFVFEGSDFLKFDDIKAMSLDLISNDLNDTMVGFDGMLAGSNNNDLIIVEDDGSFGYSDDNIIYGNYANKSISVYGLNGDDVIFGSSNSDYVDGGDGNDKIYASYGDDVIYGRSGDDHMSGGYGNDTFIFSLGDGKDIIYDDDGIDSIKFGAGISKEDLIVLRNEDNFNDILIKFKNSPNDSITLQHAISWDKTSQSIIENFVFINGDTLRFNDIKNMSLIGSDNDDVIIGYNENNIFIGNKGDDILAGKSGNDTYIFNKGDGNDQIYANGGSDTIKFGSNLNANEIKFSQISNNLLIKYGQDDQITITNYFLGRTRSGDYIVENFSLEDGSILTSDQINKIIQDFYALNTQNNSEFDGFSFSEIQNQSNLQIYG